MSMPSAANGTGLVAEHLVMFFGGGGMISAPLSITLRIQLFQPRIINNPCKYFLKNTTSPLI